MGAKAWETYEYQEAEVPVGFERRQRVDHVAFLDHFLDRAVASDRVAWSADRFGAADTARPRQRLH
eukprot:scaffold318647_cov29-Prasinocladus_malaysianus.AAC.1